MKVGAAVATAAVVCLLACLLACLLKLSHLEAILGRYWKTGRGPWAQPKARRSGGPLVDILNHLGARGALFVALPSPREGP